VPGVLDPEERLGGYLRADAEEWGRYTARFGTHLVQVMPAAGAAMERIGAQKIGAISEMARAGLKTAFAPSRELCGVS
jgi:hypothetical protein